MDGTFADDPWVAHTGLLGFVCMLDVFLDFTHKISWFLCMLDVFLEFTTVVVVVVTEILPPSKQALSGQCH